MEPPPAAAIAGTTACAAKNWWRRFTAKRSSQYSGVTASIAWRSSCAALLTRTRTAPSRAQRRDVSQIAPDERGSREAARRNAGHERVGGLALDVHEGDAGSLRAQVLDDGGADATAAAGHEDDAIFQAGVRGISDHEHPPALHVGESLARVFVAIPRSAT